MRRAAAAAFFLSALAQDAGAQDYPTRAVKIVVPYAPGGGTDAVARPLAQRLAEKWGQPVIIENRAGAGTSIGAEAVARAAPDGYTLLLSDATTFTVNPHVYRRLPYDPLSDLAPVSIVCRFTPVIAAHVSVPASNLDEFIALAKRQPGTLSYGSFGNGTYAHVAMEEFKRRAGIDIVHVPYRGGALAVNDLIAGQISSAMATATNFSEHEKAGKVRILAAATERRPSLRSELQTVGETLPGYAIDVFVAIAAPARTPDAILEKVSRDVAAIVADPVYRDRYYTTQYLEPVGSTREEFASVLRRDDQRWRELVERTGARVD